jgi:hypothetical protein
VIYSPHEIAGARAVSLLETAQRYGARLKRVGPHEWAGPCPLCGGVDRFSINTRKQLFNCRYCDVGGDVIAFVQHVERRSFQEAVETLTGEKTSEDRSRPIAAPPRADDRTDVERERAKARWFWSQRRPIAGTIAEVYLRQARGYGGVIQPTLAFLPARAAHEPALIAAFGIATEPEPGVLAIADDAVMAVQLVKLKPDGSGKADVEPNKIIIGRGALGVPIVLAPPNDLLGLAVCEGIEDALSIHAATGLGAWASGGAGRMPALADAVPDYIDFVRVVADRDPAGIKGARGLAEGLRQRGIEHKVRCLGGQP